MDVDESLDSDALWQKVRDNDELESFKDPYTELFSSLISKAQWSLYTLLSLDQPANSEGRLMYKYASSMVRALNSEGIYVRNRNDMIRV